MLTPTNGFASIFKLPSALGVGATGLAVVQLQAGTAVLSLTLLGNGYRLQKDFANF